IGHGSGKLSERLKGGAEPYLKGYFSTLEEGRADLSALWNAWDPKLKELGLVSNQEEVAKAMYDSAAMAALTQLRRIPKGDSIEEDHQRDRQLIVNYIRARVPGANVLGRHQFETDRTRCSGGTRTGRQDQLPVRRSGAVSSLRLLVRQIAPSRGQARKKVKRGTTRLVALDAIQRRLQHVQVLWSSHQLLQPALQVLIVVKVCAPGSSGKLCEHVFCTLKCLAVVHRRQAVQKLESRASPRSSASISVVYSTRASTELIVKDVDVPQIHFPFWGPSAMRETPSKNSRNSN